MPTDSVRRAREFVRKRRRVGTTTLVVGSWNGAASVASVAGHGFPGCREPSTMAGMFARALVFLLLLTPPVAGQQSSATPRELLRSGPMVGYGTLREAAIWLQTTRPASVQIRYWPAGSREDVGRSPVIRTTAAGDHIAQLLITGLEFGTRYEYEVLLDGKPVSLGYPARFQTQEMWQWRTDPPPFRMAVGSCAYVNDPEFDRPGTPYGSGMEIFTVLAAQQPDVMLWIGDNVYLREADWESEPGIRYRYAHTRALPEMQPILAAAHNYATWDDHDYGPNDSDRSYPLRATSLEVFRDYWANRTFGTLETPGVFQRFVWQDVEVFMLDDRFWRTPNAMPEGQPRTMLGEAQLQWLKESLVSSRAPFKLVVNGNQIINLASGEETLRAIGHEFEQLIGIIRDARIAGVVFVSGDRHHSILMREQFEGIEYPIYELTASPFTAGNHPPREGTDFPHVVPGTLVADKKNFALLDFSGPRTDRTMKITIVDIDGTERWTREIRARDLQFGTVSPPAPASGSTP